METTKIKMIRSQAGSTDGMHVELFKAGEVYDIPVDLAKVFIDNKWAKPFIEEPIELKGVGPAPKNKMVEETVENKEEEIEEEIEEEEIEEVKKKSRKNKK